MPSTNKMSTFTESFDDDIDSVAMETQLIWLFSDMNIHSVNILQLFQHYVVSQDAPLCRPSHRRARINGTIVILTK